MVVMLIALIWFICAPAALLMFHVSYVEYCLGDANWRVNAAVFVWFGLLILALGAVFTVGLLTYGIQGGQ